MSHAAAEGHPAAANLRAIIGALFVVAMLWLVPDLPVEAQPDGIVLEHAKVISVDAADSAMGTAQAQVEIIDGARAGERLTADVSGTGRGASGGSQLIQYAPGDEVVIQVSTTPEGELVAISDRWRAPILGAVLAGFALLVVIVARWRGVRALLALGLTVATVYKILLPLLIAGWDPVVLAVGCGSVVTVVTLVLTEGWRRSTLAAAIGTFGALAATALIAAVVTAAAGFSILQGSEDVGFLQAMIGSDVDLSGLLLASIILGALGVLDDVTITQAATVDELVRSDPSASRGAIVGRAMNVGRSHIAATVNTLVLAYTAAALPLLLLFALTPQPIGALASTEVVAVEIVRAVVGSMGIVLAVPFTTLVAVRLAHRGRSGAVTSMARRADLGGDDR